MARALARRADRHRPRGDPARPASPERLIATTERPDPLERLELADWRRRVADLYAAIRAEAAADPERAWEAWRRTREELFRTHPQSPVPAAERTGYAARHWPYDPRYRLEAVVESGDSPSDGPGQDVPAAGRAGAAPVISEPFLGGLTLALPVSTGGQEELTRIGSVELRLPDGPGRLGVYWMAGYAGGIFVPFRDATNGGETYGAGRYLLDTAKSADLGPGTAPGSLVLDFNFSFHPSCAFDPRWSCPLAPPENRLDVGIEAGERLR